VLVADYRVYCLNGTGKIGGAGEWVQANSNDEILALTKPKKLNVRCDIWDGIRMAALIHPSALSA
jgi:hypothetical protein